MQVAALAREDPVGMLGKAAVGKAVAQAEHLTGAKASGLGDRDALARPADAAAGGPRLGITGKRDAQAGWREGRLVGHHANVRAQRRRNLRRQHGLDVLAQAPRGEDERHAAVVRRGDQLDEPGPQFRDLHRELLDLRLASGDVLVDRLDDAPGVELARPKTPARPLPVRRAAEMPADLVADVGGGCGAVEVADDGQRR